MEGFHPLIRQWFERTFGAPTETQRVGWPPIRAGQDTLICAPTGTGKTFTAFLALLDDLLRQGLNGTLTEGIQAVYLSPLKALGNDIAVNLQKPLEGIEETCKAAGLTMPAIRVAIRNGDTTSAERARMLNHPPHVLITTPESLYLLLTGTRSCALLVHVRVVIVDELHALLDTKRGAHLSLSLERLRALCTCAPQRIGLSATLASLQAGAAFLAGARDETTPRPAVCIQPVDDKRMTLSVTAPLDDLAHPPDGTIWPALIQNAYEAAQTVRTTLIFVNGRATAEKMAAGLCALAGEADFACTHHGSMDKERRLEAEKRFKAGTLRCLCATSSMELGIDVGEVELVLQVGCPKRVSRGLQRLGRAGHGPQRVSEMRMLPRTAADALECALVGREMLDRRVEPAEALTDCLDVLAQHCVSIAAGGEMTVEALLHLVRGAWGYRALREEELIDVLRMLSGAFAHAQGKPARPRLFYDAVQGRVSGDAYSRMLACSGSTIPDRGMFPVYLEDGTTRLGELDEEFVFEARVGDRFMLGAFPWQMTRIGRDRVIVRAVGRAGAQVPFWRGEEMGRPYALGVRIGAWMRRLEEGLDAGEGAAFLMRLLPMDARTALQVHAMLREQREQVGVLPTDRRMLVEHFRGDAGNDCMMVHSPFGGRVHQGLGILLSDALHQAIGGEVLAYHADDGVLCISIGTATLPDDALSLLSPDCIEDALMRLLPGTALFAMVYRYAAMRALMLGMGRRGVRQPLWAQRQRGAASLEEAMKSRDHPLLLEAARECIHQQIDVPHLCEILCAVAEKRIDVVEWHAEKPSPLTREARRLFVGDAMYTNPVPEGARRNALPVRAESVGLAALRPPDAQWLDQAAKPMRAPQSADALHAQLMQEGDLRAGEVDAPYAWLEALSAQGRVQYIEPGLWIATEQASTYTAICTGGENLSFVLARTLRYRGGMTEAELTERYALSEETVLQALQALCAEDQIILHDGRYWHAQVYRHAAYETRAARTRTVQTAPPASLQALTISLQLPPPGEDRLLASLRPLRGLWLPCAAWESMVLPARVPRYRPAMLDRMLLTGALVWRVKTEASGKLLLCWMNPMDMQGVKCPLPQDASPAEKCVYDALADHGAMFTHALSAQCGPDTQQALLSLLARGLVINDGFAPLRVLIAPQISARGRQHLLAQSGRWALATQVREMDMASCLDAVFDRFGIVCRETVTAAHIAWGAALEYLRQAEYVGSVRRGYYVQGLSGAQFLRETEADARMAQLAHPMEEETVLLAPDPAQLWGGMLSHQAGASFLCVPGCCVVLRGGVVSLIAERYGESLRFEEAQAVQAFAKAFSAGRIWAEKPKILVHAWPAQHTDDMMAAGFVREMDDCVLWRKAF